MPLGPDTLAASVLLRAMVLAEAKTGKTGTLIMSAIRGFGRGYVIECSPPEHLRSVKTVCAMYGVPEKAPDGSPLWEYDLVQSFDDMERALKAAAKGVKEGLYKWIVLDDFSVYAWALEQAIMSMAGSGHKSERWHDLCNKLVGVAVRLCQIPAHVVCASHLIEQSPEIDGQTKKSGVGVFPLVTGAARQKLPTLFNQVILMNQDKGGQRVFHLSPKGVYGGVGVHGMKEAQTIEADLGKLVAELSAFDSGPQAQSTVKP